MRVRGNQMVLDGRPFRFVGANLAVMHHPENRARADDVLAAAAADGIRVGRIWALGEGTAEATPWQRDNFLFRAGPTGWIEAGPDQLDRVLVAARRVGIRLVITLSNSWSDYGGVPQYLRWAGQWREKVFGSGDRFYSDPAARAAFRGHVERLLRRTNRINGIPYRDDPTILAWELMNESSVLTASGAAARQRWIVEMARAIRQLDPNHLITPGVSYYRVERERKDWLAICRLPEVDFCDGHIYPEEILRNRDPAAMDAVIDDFVQLAQHVAGKPFVLGEFGITGDSAGSWLGQPRAVWMKRVLDRLNFDAAAGGLVWIYQPGAIAQGAHGIAIDDPRALDVRRALREAARRLEATPSAATNPLLGPDRGEAALLPLHSEFVGQSAVIPVLDKSMSGSFGVSWDPAVYQRARWEATGLYAGGAIEHAWGGESGWFEYAFDVPAHFGGQVARSLSLSARVSSEYPGVISPPEGASVFEVALDGQRFATSVAPRDDGEGRWITLRSSDTAVLRAAMRPGRHVLRFTVPPGARAHGLCLYGAPGKTPGKPVKTGPIELTVHGISR